ncbi:unnamed protein product [Haemonchus placei]|uniref:Uncharacterized protein n=1 Tax=Haemonchus placei TaxID=6290 RepID=A0A3P7TLL8_HAEPC|nr:unnamed protein product [Haemonchus placei]
MVRFSEHDPVQSSFHGSDVISSIDSFSTFRMEFNPLMQRKGMDSPFLLYRIELNSSNLAGPTHAYEYGEPAHEVSCTSTQPFKARIQMTGSFRYPLPDYQ